jgi:hypothetical protein
MVFCGAERGGMHGGRGIDVVFCVVNFVVEKGATSSGFIFLRSVKTLMGIFFRGSPFG